MKYQRNIMGTLIYHNMSVSQSCLHYFYAIPIFPFKFPKLLFTGLLSFFGLPEAIFYKIYIVYGDIITMFIIGLVSFTIFTFR